MEITNIRSILSARKFRLVVLSVLSFSVIVVYLAYIPKVNSVVEPFIFITHRNLTGSHPEVYLPQENELDKKVGDVGEINIDKYRARNMTRKTKTYHPKCSKELCRKYPNFIIIGGKKCGTAALKVFLSIHPALKVALRGYKSQEVSQENSYFLYSRHEVLSDKQYWKTMPKVKKGQLVYEKSIYFNSRENAAANIKKFCAKYDIAMKFILLVREPVTRMISDFARLRAHYPEYKKVSLNHALNNRGRDILFRLLIDDSNYYAEMKRWLEHFPLDRFLILNSNEFIKNPIPSMQKVEKFLNIPSFYNDDVLFLNKEKGFYCYRHATKETLPRYQPVVNGTKCLGESKGRAHEKQSKKFVREWISYFRPRTQKFFNLTKVHFDWSKTEQDLLEKSYD